MRIETTRFNGLVIVHSSPREDSRGSFERMFCASALESSWGPEPILQVNRSVTRRAGSIRGLHFQRPPFAEKKMIRCLRGRVIDYAVDLRRGSPTLLRVFSIELSPEAGKEIIIPEGFAHGFQALEPDSELIYFHSRFYSPEHEGGVSFLDPKLGIKPPLPIAEISKRDSEFGLISDEFDGIVFDSKV
jgi:dTDP-4-dehydrorhamnose 3,5-epimerase